MEIIHDIAPRGTQTVFIECFNDFYAVTRLIVCAASKRSKVSKETMSSNAEEYVSIVIGFLIQKNLGSICFYWMTYENRFCDAKMNKLCFGKMRLTTENCFEYSETSNGF